MRAASLAAFVAVVLMPLTAMAQAPHAGVVTGLQGSTSVVRVATAQPQALAVKDEILAGDQIVTGDVSQARLLLGYGALLTVYPRSALTIGADSGGSPLTLTSGVVLYHVLRERMPAGAVYEVRTPNAVVRLRGTVVRVAIDPPAQAHDEARTSVCVVSGRASAGHLHGAAVEVGPRQCVSITGERLSPGWPNQQLPLPRDDGLSIGLR